MKKILIIIKSTMIIIGIFILSLLLVKLSYSINHQNLDTNYIWNIEFNNFIVNKDSKNGELKINDDELTLNITLEKELEFYEFSFDVDNRGTLAAKLVSLTYRLQGDSKFLISDITYQNGNDISIGDIIKNNEKKTIKVKIQYPKQKAKIYKALKLELTLKLAYEPIRY